MPFLAPIFGGIMAFRAVQNVVRLSKWYQRNKLAQAASSGPFGFLYAGGTVLGYNTISPLFKPKWKYLGSPQRVSKI